MNELAPKFQHTRAWLLAGLAAVFMQALPNLRYPIGEDHATFCMIGQGILEGKLPYRDLWDIKPPGIYYVYALIVKIFGPVMWCLGVVDILWLLLISCWHLLLCPPLLGDAGRGTGDGIQCYAALPARIYSRSSARNLFDALCIRRLVPIVGKRPLTPGAGGPLHPRE